MKKHKNLERQMKEQQEGDLVDRKNPDGRHINSLLFFQSRLKTLFVSTVVRSLAHTHAHTSPVVTEIDDCLLQ